VRRLQLKNRIQAWTTGQVTIVSVGLLLLTAWTLWARLQTATSVHYETQTSDCQALLPDTLAARRCLAEDFSRLTTSFNEGVAAERKASLLGWAAVAEVATALLILWVWFGRPARAAAS
jgi:hypothetical protein